MSVLEAVPTTTAPERRRLMGSAYDLSGAKTADEARVLAGLEWEAIHRPLYVDLPDTVAEGGIVPIEKERGVIRDDSGAFFGVVGAEHKILSNADFFDFADTLLSEADTDWASSEPFGGALADGKAPFLAFQLGEGIQVAGQDAVNCAVLLSNGHVGNTAFTVTVTPIRMKCSNVVRATIRAGRKGQNLACYTVQHSGDLSEKMRQVHEALAVRSAYMLEFEAMANRLADVDFGLSDFDDLLADLIPLADDAGDRARKTVSETRGKFRLNWLNTTTIDAGLKPTAWGALNVITEVIDHGNLDVRKSQIPAAERRMNSVHFGAGARLRDRAYSLLGAA
jgi:phage/plasmid-like protein (TIGR03299 family)